MKGRAYTTQEVIDIFEKGGCKFLDDVYDYKKKINYMCSCGNLSTTIVSRFLKGCRCRNCQGPKIRAKHLYSYEEVKNKFAEHGCLLISREYKGHQYNLEFLCRCGKNGSKCLHSFMKNPFCKSCGRERVSGKNSPRFKDNLEHKLKLKEIQQKSHSLLYSHLKSKGSKQKYTREKLLGYNMETFRKYFYNHPNWDNVKDQKWSMDHIFPIMAFVEHKIENLSIINHLNNIRPCLLSENHKKNVSYNKTDFYAWLDSIGYTNYTKQLEDNQNEKNV